MTLVRRLTLSCVSILTLCMIVSGVVFYFEFSVEPGAVPSTSGEEAGEEDEPWDTLLQIGLPIILCGAVGGWWLVHSALRPIRELTAAAAKLRSDQLGETLPRSGNGDEIDQLSGILNHLLSELQTSMTRIREFTMHASHELKTPLTIMKGELEGVLRRGFEKGTPLDFCVSQMEEVRRLSRLVEGLTILAKADAGLHQPPLFPVLLQPLVRDAYEAAELLSEGRISVILLECTPCTVAGDQDTLRQLFLNLVDNALKYNISEGVVRISLAQTEGHAIITIANTGLGLGPDQTEKIFQRFYRGDSSRNGAVPGTGLGLSICEWICRMHHGTISCTSQSAGETVFHVRIPLLLV